MTDRSFDIIEMESLRKELILRMALQNTLLIVSIILFTCFAVAATAMPPSAWAVAAAQNATILGAALQWCHHGVRTAQIKRYLMRLHPSTSSWEAWLPANRPPTPLGSRWMISTKGVFLGLGLASIVLAALSAPKAHHAYAVLAIVQLAATAAFLLTNPKE